MRSWIKHCYAAWEQFWFRPADPTRLGMIRIGCGIIVVYTMIAYSFHLDEFLGESSWYDLKTRMYMLREGQVFAPTWSGLESPLSFRLPQGEREEHYLKSYVQFFGQLPPMPYPRTDEEAAYCFEFWKKFRFDLRLYGLPPPASASERRFLEEFAAEFGKPPAPPYPHDAAEEKEIFAYMRKNHVDPHRLLARGQPVFSLWFTVTDPAEMRWLHAVVLITSLLFLAGFCTRITAALTWFFFLNYVHRVPNIMFGADSMLSIVLLYLMIGPSGAALSVDRLIARKWGRNYQTRPAPSVGANLALRLLQIHLCIIYGVAGLAKLMGNSWWNGIAVWGTIAHYEMAPMTNSLYIGTLRLLAESAAVFSTFLFVGTYFTLAFEIGYPFLIWLPRFRRLFVSLAFVLHGLIGVIMGLASFSIIMFVMNMAFWKDRPQAEASAARG